MAGAAYARRGTTGQHKQHKPQQEIPPRPASGEILYATAPPATADRYSTPAAYARRATTCVPRRWHRTRKDCGFTHPPGVPIR